MQVPQEKLLLALERALVDVVNKVGVEINKAVRDPYYASLLPFVCGFGPRKAEAAIKKIQGLDKLVSPMDIWSIYLDCPNMSIRMAQLRTAHNSFWKRS